MLTDRFDEALAYASRLHRHQKRKGTAIPYVAHLLGVASIALESGADEDQAIAALLHDAVEDHDVTVAEIEARFGAAVATIVAHCTDAEPAEKAKDRSYAAWRRRKEAYVESLERKPAPSLLVSLADKTHNARSILSDLMVEGNSVWDRFTGGKSGSLWYYDALARAFLRLLPGPPADRLDALVAELHARADMPR